jgi:hypothetical protein
MFSAALTARAHWARSRARRARPAHGIGRGPHMGSGAARTWASHALADLG